MQDDPTQPNINSWLEDELRQQFQHDRKTVDATWTAVLEGNGYTATASAARDTRATVADPPRSLALRAPEVPVVAVGVDDQLIPLRGPALRIAENMSAS